MPIFAGARYIIPELLYIWHNIWTYINIYNKYISKANIYALIPNAQNKYL